ncbi:MAG: GntR family transcriptional regulator [Vulcanimicrobiaceae bacterium]
MTAEPLAPSRHGTVADALRRAILTGTIAPGTKLVQEDLAARFGVSRIPLREALRTLEGEGLVVIAVNRGAICRPLEAKDLADLYDVRLCLEALGIRTAAARFVDLRAPTAAKRQLAIAAIKRRDLPALFALDSAFHAELARAGGNDHLGEALTRYWSQIMRAMHLFFSFTRYPEDVWGEHLAIADAVRAGDGDGAVAILTTHISKSRDAILRSLKEARS